MKRSYRDKVVWITGASSGIGEACAYRFAREGAKVIVTARRADVLSKVVERCLSQGASAAIALPADLSRTDSLEELAARAWESFGGIDVFFANAGISQRCPTVEAGMDVIRRVMDLDYFAPVILTKALLPRMLERGGGQLACTSSIAGLFGSKHRCAYCSAKAAIKLFYETIGVEYHDQGILTTVIIPGRVRTDISYSALEAGGKAHGKMDKGQESGISPEKCADTIYKAIARGKREQLTGGAEILMAYIKRFFPGLCFRISRGLKP